MIFFNNVGTIGMCGHGTIGLVATLAYLGRIAPGEHRIVVHIEAPALGGTVDIVYNLTVVPHGHFD